MEKLDRKKKNLKRQAQGFSGQDKSLNFQNVVNNSRPRLEKPEMPSAEMSMSEVQEEGELTYPPYNNMLEANADPIQAGKIKPPKASQKSKPEDNSAFK